MRLRERGAAVVMAMLVVTLGVLLVSGAFQRQSVMAREVENLAAAAQTRSLLAGAVDWVRVILREDARNSGVDHLGEPWAVSLEQTRVDNDSGDPAWLSGGIEDAQARFNLRNLAGPTGPVASEVAVLRRLLWLTGADPVLAERIALLVDTAVWGRQAAAGMPVVMPATIEELAIPGMAEREALQRLRPFVTLLPVPAPVNANTASAEVLAARFDNLSLADARRLVASRERAYFKDVHDLLGRLPGWQPAGGTGQIAVATQFFLLHGAVEYRRAHSQALALLKREGGRVEVVWARERLA